MICLYGLEKSSTHELVFGDELAPYVISHIIKTGLISPRLSSLLLQAHPRRMELEYTDRCDLSRMIISNDPTNYISIVIITSQN